MNLATERARLTGLLSSVAGLQVYAKVPGKPVPPCLVLSPGPYPPHSALDGSADVKFVGELMVQMADFDAAQDSLDGYVSTVTGSVVNALEVDGGVSVDRVGQPSTTSMDDGNTRFMSITLDITVLA